MNILRKLRNYFCYCGIEKEEYDQVKKGAYISNFKVWRILHILMTAIFGILFISSLMSDLMSVNRGIYLLLLIYCGAATILFFTLEEDSLVAQLLIYLSISVLFVFGCLITQNKPDRNATTFIVFLLITPMFMIDKPFFMAIELCAASVVFAIWMYGIKPREVWVFDLTNVIIFTVVGILLHIVANSIRIKEFVLTRKIHIQRDTDELTGLKNKFSLTREINAHLQNGTSGKGIMFLMDVDHFKSVNDTYGHDVGDQVIHEMGTFLGDMFQNGEIAGRFGGDEFIVFIKDTDDKDRARRVAEDMVKGASETISLPDRDQKVSISIGIAFYHGSEKNYSEIFKKADTALYKAKADPVVRYSFYE
ncbi:MAG: diguanylate cyclase [Lachnospiraceae bacterium]|nr:diguanylate cyclase [Lachnospiraceae bacterium]